MVANIKDFLEAGLERNEREDRASRCSRETRGNRDRRESRNAEPFGFPQSNCVFWLHRERKAQHSQRLEAVTLLSCGAVRRPLNNELGNNRRVPSLIPLYLFCGFLCDGREHQGF